MKWHDEVCSTLHHSTLKLVRWMMHQACVCVCYSEEKRDEEDQADSDVQTTGME